MINRVKIPIKDEEGNVLYEMNLRDYAISIWTLQDVFINVLKGFNSDIPGMIMDPHMTLSDDGTQDLTFTIPMYIKQNGQLIENPIWYNTRNGNLIANMRKIKVIFRKTQDEEKIYEFLITQIEESHSDDQLTCSLTCEGLAFHELGKIGYKHELSSDQFLTEYNEWADGEKTTPEPVNNLQYWVEHQLGISPLPTGENAVIDPQVWYYKVDMNWDAYVDSAKREPNIVYEEGYVSSWTDGEASEPKSTVSAHEKLAMLDENESNDYNLTQAIAEKFRVHCRYEYGHDEHYHITSRTIIFYNNFIKEAEGYLGFIYPYSTNDISRSMDSTDIITKMYVRSIEDDSTGSGLITIMDSEANKSREDYIFNFDYLYEIGAVDSDILEDVRKHEDELRKINNQLIPMQEHLITINDNLNKAKADLAFAENSIAQDIERKTQNNSQMNALGAVDGISDNKISVKESAPKMAVVIYDKHGRCAINITEKGVLYDTIKVYESYTMLPAANESRLQSKIPILRGEFDEFNNLTKIYVATKPDRPVYMIYDYQPRLYWEHIAQVWDTRLAADTAKKEAAEANVQKLTAQKETLDASIKLKQQQKQKIITSFNQHLGPAIREGYWTPEDYKNCEDRYSDVFSSIIHVNARTKQENNNDIIVGYETRGNTIYNNFLWDVQTFSGEDLDYYQLGVTQDTYMYPWIDISDKDLDPIDNTLTLVYHDFDSDENKSYTLQNAHFLVVGSSCQFGFIQYGGQLKTAIILTNRASMSDTEFKFLCKNSYLAHITSTNNEIQETIVIRHDQLVLHNEDSIISLNNKPWQRLYPRVEFTTLAIKTDTINFDLKYNDNKLEQYTDYSILSRDGCLYATIKPEALLRNGGINKQLNLFFTVSRASTAIYLDAKEVLKENSRPQVSYSIKPSVFNLEFMHTAYEALDRIVDINDTQLKFENVQGYITKLDLDLDNPWEDSIEVKNYKTKFEDLFTSIVASTEEMKRNSELYTTTANLFNRNGTLKSNILQNSINSANLNYSFNNGALTIDPTDGIWGISESGVVAMRGGGIFTATEKDANGNWIWNTGILPQGINANLLTAGQLDTNKILIYAGDNVRFQMNSEGLYAYKYMTNEERTLAALSILKEENNELLEQFNTDMLNSNYIDSKQYVVHDPDGIFLRAEAGAWIYAMHQVEDENNEPKFERKLFQLTQPVDRVSISWEGLKLRNWNGEDVFYADPDYGNLTLKGTVRATAFTAEGNNSKFFADGEQMGFYQTVTITGDTYTASDPILTISDTAINATGDLSIKSGKQLKIEGENNNYVTINKDGVTINGEWLKVDTGNFILDSVKSEIEFKKGDNSIVKINNDGANIKTTNLILESIPNGNTTPKLQLKNGTQTLFDFSNSSLTITGTINATGGTFSGNITAKGTITGGIITGATINGSAINVPETNSKFTVDKDGDVVANSITIGSGNNKLTYDGQTLSVTGNITANNGTFNGTINASDGTFTGTITSATINSGTINGSTINIPATNSLFTVDNAGNVTATSITIGSDSNGKLTYTSSNGLVVSTNSKLGDWIIGSKYLYNDNIAGLGINGTIGTKNWMFVVDDAQLRYYTDNFVVNGDGHVYCNYISLPINNSNIGLDKNGDLSANGNITLGSTGKNIVITGNIGINNITLDEDYIITGINKDSNDYVTSMTIGGQSVNFTNAADITISGASTNVSNTAIIYPYHTGKRSRLGTNYKNITLSRNWVGYTVTVDAYLDNNIIASNTTDYSQDISNAQSSAISNLDIEYNDNRNITADGDNWKIYYTGDISGYILVPKADIPSSKE